MRCFAKIDHQNGREGQQNRLAALATLADMAISLKNGTRIVAGGADVRGLIGLTSRRSIESAQICVPFFVFSAARRLRLPSLTLLRTRLKLAG
jgi:hypothetical protein